MRGSRRLLLLLVPALMGCPTDATLFEAPPGPPNFTARVTFVRAEHANGPAGPYSQTDVFLSVPFGTETNAGLVVPDKIPVGVRRGVGGAFAATPAAIAVGDRIEVWHDGLVGYSSAQPPADQSMAQFPEGVPVYTATAVVIDRRKP